MVEPRQSETQERVASWFRSKRLEMMAASELPQDHSGLIGGHREAIFRSFLQAFLPGRLSVDRGIVYNFLDRSGECDAVIWDSHNFPRLAMLDHSSFFIESVSAIVEIKSNYSAAELNSCRDRCEALRRLSILPGSGRYAVQWSNQLESIESRLSSVEAGLPWAGMVSSSTRVGYGVIFLKGGSTVTIDDMLNDPMVNAGDEVDFDRLPSFTCFLDSGRFFRRWEPSMVEHEEGENPFIARHDCADDVLMCLADELLRLIRVHSPSYDGMWDLGGYVGLVRDWQTPVESHELTLTRFPYGHKWLP